MRFKDPRKAKKHRTMVVIIGIGSLISAMIGAAIVLDLPATLQKPITSPRYADGK